MSRLPTPKAHSTQKSGGEAPDEGRERSLMMPPRPMAEHPLSHPPLAGTARCDEDALLFVFVLGSEYLARPKCILSPPF